MSQTKLVKKNETHYILNKSLTYLFTPWSRFLIQKLTGFKLVKKFTDFSESGGSLPQSTD